MISISNETCVTALNTAALNRRRALHLELAVGLAVFASGGDKITLCAVYADAGYDCVLPDGKDYKTVNRRVNVSAHLHARLGNEAVEAITGRHRNVKALELLAAAMADMGFHTIVDVQDFFAPVPRRLDPDAAVPSNVVQLDHQRRSDDAGFAYRVETEHIHIGVPEGTGSSEVIRAAHQLFDLARKIVEIEISVKAA